MSNQQLYPTATYPISGDVQSTPGQHTVVVTGIQTVPVVTTLPLDQQSIVFQASVGEYVPTNVPFNQSILVGGVSMSDDYDFFVKNVDTSAQVNSPYSPSGKPALVNGV